MKMYRFIDEKKLQKEIKNINPYIIVSEWADNAFELEKNLQIQEIKKIFFSFDKKELNEFRILKHLDMIFQELSDENIYRFLTSQKHLIVETL